MIYSLVLLFFICCVYCIDAQRRMYCPQFPYSQSKPLVKPYQIDSRCTYLIKDYSECHKKVETPSGMVVEGYNIFLCDGPGVEKRDRPESRRIIPRYYKEVTAFLGIPYARPPLRALRFKPPQPPYAHYVNATYYRPLCPQHNDYIDDERVDEDCLYLNIFTQFPHQNRLGLPYPVLVYIHGGYWDHGSPRTFPGHMLAASQDVVVVTISYRLGLLGFLATGDEEAPGNYGMLDQVEALRWIHTNIGVFNGDRSRITLVGLDAGAASAGLLALSPLCKTPIQGVVAIDGAAMADWAYISDPAAMRNASHALGEALGCAPGSRLVSCLSNRSVNDTRQARIKPRVGWLPFGPVIDNMTRPLNEQFLPKPPPKLLEEISFITRGFFYVGGVSKNAGAELVAADKELGHYYEHEVSEGMFYRKIRQFMDQYNYSRNADATFNALKFMYQPWANPLDRNALRQGYIDMLSDAHYKAPNDAMLKKLLSVSGATVYMYVLNYTLQGLPQPGWLGPIPNSEVLLTSGAPFMDPILYPSSMGSLLYARWTEADRNVSQLFMEALGNLAKYRKPSPQQLFNTILWEPMAQNELLYLGINGTDGNLTRMERDYRQRDSVFWQEYLPQLVNRDAATLPPTLEADVEARHVLSASLWTASSAAFIFAILGIIFCCLFLLHRKRDSY